ncbi:hypothetical protein RhiirB3_419634 [Rhizophagus irregularis]|nr:hypothetical protein RhiirB3_419634 [Rhizophagus irregularis]
MPVSTCYDNNMEVIKIIIAPLSLPLIRLTCALKLFDILSEAYRDLMLFILRDTDKVFGLLNCIIDSASAFFLQLFHTEDVC